jgi:PAS domain S-box-containing protein
LRKPALYALGILLATLVYLLLHFSGWFEDARMHPWREAVVLLVVAGLAAGAVLRYRFLLKKAAVAAGETARVNAALQAEIEERVHAEAERDRFFDLSMDLLAIAGTDGYFKQLNPAWEKVLGWTCDELRARPYAELVHPEDRAATAREARRLRLGGNTVDFENRFRTKDGTWRWLSWRSTAVPERGLIYAVARDIHERKKVEQLKADFISVVSHELRTPLTSIRGSLGLIAGGVVGELPEKARSLVAIAAKNSERLVRLINDILDVEKIELGQMGFHFVPQELMPLIEQALESNRAYAQPFQIELRLLETAPGVRVRVDADRLQQVLANLLSNAAKFSPRGGTVDVRVMPRENGVRVEVIDHGKGIPEEFQPRVFEKFAQADASSSRQKGGTGLGLSISRAIIERHGGHMGFLTAPDAGTTFWFDLPEWTAVDTAATGLEPGAPRVLICEDDPDVAALLHLMLRQAGYQADVAYGAAEAKRRIAAGSYAAMTLDLLLPDQDGLSLIRELRAEDGPDHLPIVVVSAHASEGQAELNGGVLGVIDWLVKPVDQERLTRAVQRAVRQAAGGRARILHVEDDADLRSVVAAIVEREADMEHAASLGEARQKLARERFDLLILDLALPDGSGLELVPVVSDLTPPTPVIIFSAHEVDVATAGRVASVLVKSQTSNRELLEKIQHVLGP